MTRSSACRLASSKAADRLAVVNRFVYLGPPSVAAGLGWNRCATQAGVPEAQFFSEGNEGEIA